MAGGKRGRPVFIFTTLNYVFQFLSVAWRPAPTHIVCIASRVTAKRITCRITVADMLETRCPNNEITFDLWLDAKATSKARVETFARTRPLQRKWPGTVKSYTGRNNVYGNYTAFENHAKMSCYRKYELFTKKVEYISKLGEKEDIFEIKKISKIFSNGMSPSSFALSMENTKYLV